MEFEEYLLQGAANDILEEYFPRPNITMPPPILQQVVKASQPIEPKKLARESNDMPRSRKRVTWKQDGCYRSEERVNNGMTDEEIQAFLLTRSKRGRGSIGGRAEEKTSSSPATTTTSTSFSSLRTSSSYQENSRREIRGGRGGVLGSRVREHGWSRMTVVTTTTTTSTKSVVAAEVPKLWNPVEAWRNGVFGSCKKRDQT